MVIGKVVGTVVTTISHANLRHRKILVVQPLDLGAEGGGGDFLAVDNAQAGIGDTVLVVREGNGVRQVLGIKDACINSAIVGIVDSISLDL